MKFAPKTKEELETLNLLKPGVYHFSVANAEDKVSKSGNEMIALTLEVYDNSSNRNVFDYLLEAMPQKLHSFCEATNMLHQYQHGTLKAHECIGKSAYVELAIQKGKENPQGGNYPDKNEVKRYITKSEKEAGEEKKAEDAKPVFVDDDIPF